MLSIYVYILFTIDVHVVLVPALYLIYFHLFCLSVTEKQLREKIQQLLSEKSDAVNKISELNAVVSFIYLFSLMF